VHQVGRKKTAIILGCTVNKT